MFTAIPLWIKNQAGPLVWKLVIHCRHCQFVVHSLLQRAHASYRIVMSSRELSQNSDQKTFFLNILKSISVTRNFWYVSVSDDTGLQCEVRMKLNKKSHSMALIHKQNIHQQTKKKSKRLVFKKKRKCVLVELDIHSEHQSAEDDDAGFPPRAANDSSFKMFSLATRFANPAARRGECRSIRSSPRRFPASSAEPQRRDSPRVPHTSTPPPPFNRTKARTKPRPRS